MTATETPSQLTVAASESVQAFAELVSGLTRVLTVQRIAVSSDGVNVNVWVLLSNDKRAEMNEIFRLEYDEAHRRLNSLLLKVHVIPLNRVEDDDTPSDATILFERARTAERDPVLA